MRFDDTNALLTHPYVMIVIVIRVASDLSEGAASDSNFMVLKTTKHGETCRLSVSSSSVELQCDYRHNSR